MDIKTICEKILAYKIPQEPVQHEVSDFFDQIGEQLIQFDKLPDHQREKLINALFEFLGNQDVEMDENFTFIHLIEFVGNPSFQTYHKHLLNFISKNASITSTLLLNRHLNIAKGKQWKSGLDLLKATSDNPNYTERIRKDALDYYDYQIEKNTNK